MLRRLGRTIQPAIPELPSVNERAAGEDVTSDAISDALYLPELPPVDVLVRDGVILEITETALVADPSRVVPVLEQLADIGVLVSIDDFGIGNTSISQLRDLPVARIKIDRTFIADLTGTHPRAGSEMIVKAMVDLAHSFGLEVVAEGVLDPGSRRALQEMGCPLGQGYLFSQPMKPRELPAFIASRGSIDRRPGQPGTPIARAAANPLARAVE